MNYGKAIRTARAAAGLKQNELAKQADITRSYLSLIEAGKRTPSLEALESLAQGLKVPLHLLMLLATEPEDLPPQHAYEISEASEALLRVLLESDSSQA